MSLTIPFPTPLNTDWRQLVSAHQLLRQARVTEALEIFSEITEQHFEQNLYLQAEDGGWPFIADETQPSMVWGCIYLGMYCYTQQEYSRDWLRLAQQVTISPHYHLLEDRIRSRLISLMGKARMYTGGISLTQVIKEQYTALKTLSLNPLEQALHRLVIAQAYRRLRNHDSSLKYINEAINLLRFEEEPFFYLSALELLASTYYFFNDHNPAYWDKAIHLYEQVKALAYSVLQSPEYYHQGYNLGWAYAEQGKFEEAYEYFQDGYNVARKMNSLRLKALCQYGQGFVLLQTGDYELALDVLHDSADKFYYLRLDWLTAVALNLIAAGYSNLGELDLAVDYVLRALECQRKVDNPLQLLHMVTQLTSLSYKTRRWRLFLRHLPEHYYLKIKLKKFRQVKWLRM